MTPDTHPDQPATRPEAPMPDTDLAAAARILTALADALDAAESWVDSSVMDAHYVARDLHTLAEQGGATDEDHAVAAALLAAARRETHPETHSEAHSAPVPPAGAATDDSAGEPREAVSGAPRAQESASQRLRRAADLIEQWAALGPPLAAILRTEANTAAGDLPPGVTRVVTATSVHAQTVADLILAGENT